MKKLLSIFLSIVLALTSLGAGTAVFADENPKTVSVEYSVYNGEFVLEPTVLEVSADLSNKYAAEVGYNDSSESPTILDATIAAHINLFGENFSTAAPFKIENGSWVKVINAFGYNAESSTYRINGIMAGGITDAVSEGCYIEYMFYRDSWNDAYTCFNTRSINALTNQSVTLTLLTEGYDAEWNPVLTPAANANITINGEVKGTTDDSGKITLSFDKIGTYKISAENNIGSAAIFAPWCVINVSTQLLDYVDKETKGAAVYLMDITDTLDILRAQDYLIFLKSGYDMSKHNDAFVASVKANLDENAGKLQIGKSEEIALYGAVIQILNILGYDVENFEGYNIMQAFESMDVDAIPETYDPYLFRVAIEAAKSDEFAKTLCDKLIKDHYDEGKGLNYADYSCDNNAHFIAAIARFKDEDYYAHYIEDAKALIKECTTNEGAFYSKKYTDVNTDSTALAMMAFASIGELDAAFKYYKTLIKGFEKETGVFASEFSEAYATKDALLSLEYFRNEVAAQNYEHPEEITKTTTVKATTSKNGSITKTCIVCGKETKTTIYYPKTITLSSTKYTYSGSEKKPKVSVKDSKGKTVSASNYSVKYSNNKKVGTAKAIITFSGNYSGSVTKTFKINPKGTKLTKVTPNKKGFTAKWSKQSTQISGYQIRYSKYQSFKNHTTKTVSGNKTTAKTVSGLKAKKYYVKVRTYKTVKGKKYYSNWSKYKTVKIK